MHTAGCQEVQGTEGPSLDLQNILEIPFLLLLCIYKPLPSPQCTGMTTVKTAKETSGRYCLVTCSKEVFNFLCFQ